MPTDHVRGMSDDLFSPELFNEGNAFKIKA